MTNKEAINYLKQLYPNGGHCWLDEQRIEAIGMAIKALQEEPTSEEQVKKSLISKHDDKTCKENGDFLTQESISEDLGKVGSLKSLEYYPEKKTTNKTGKGVFDANMPRRKAYLRGFKDGAHAHKELIANKPVSVDFEAAIDTYLATYFGGEKEKQDWPFLKKMAIHFAEWQKQQLMAKAIDVTIAIPYQNGYGGYTQLVDSKDGLPFGENLKVLVIEKEIYKTPKL